MMNKYLTEKEIAFIAALKNDYNIRRNKSFWKIMFWSSPDTQKELYESVEHLFGGYPEMNIIKKSDLIFECIAHMHIGKYQNCFWGTGPEGEFFAIRTELYQLPYDIFCNAYPYNDDKEEALQRVREIRNVEYLQYVEEYKSFCRQFGWEYTEQFEEPNPTTESFDKLVASLNNE